VEIKCQLDATEVCIADLIACSTCFGHHYAHHQELKSIIQWLLPVVFRAVVGILFPHINDDARSKSHQIYSVLLWNHPRNACYHLVHNLFSSSLLSKNIKIKIYRAIILPVVLYGCRTWSFTLTEGQRLRVFEYRVMKKIYGPRSNEVTREWRRLHTEELYGP
jgi:hypothetical protein